MRVHEGVEVQIYVFLTSALDGGEWSASRPSPLTPAKEPVILTGFAAWWPQSRTERLVMGKIFFLPGTEPHFLGSKSVSYSFFLMVAVLIFHAPILAFYSTTITGDITISSGITCL